MDKVSIIVPVYNAEKYLVECLDSIIAQNYVNIELILINDGSVDDSWNICKNYSDKDIRIKAINIKNHGVSYARNLGLRLATGKYILFVDADDTIDKKYISTLVEYMNKNNLDIVFCGYKNINKNIDREEIHILKDRDVLTEKLYKDFYIIKDYLNFPWSKIYRLDIIKKYNICFPVQMKVAEDQIFNYQYYSHVKRYKFINKSLYNYISRNNKSLTQFRDLETFNCEIINLGLKKQFFYKNNIEKKEKMLIEWVMNLIDMYVVVEEQDKNTYIEFKNRAKKIKNIIDLSYQDIYEIKTLLKIYLLKHNILFPLYMKGKFKILKKGMLFFHE